MAAPVSFGGRVPVPPCSVSSSGSLSGGLASSSTVPAGRSAGPPPASSDPLSRSCGFVISCSFLSRAAMLRRCWRVPREGARQPASIASNYRSIRPATTEQRRAPCEVPQITRLISPTRRQAVQPNSFTAQVRRVRGATAERGRAVRSTKGLTPLAALQMKPAQPPPVTTHSCSNCPTTVGPNT
jgi:hypothetical protein